VGVKLPFMSPSKPRLKRLRGRVFETPRGTRRVAPRTEGEAAARSLRIIYAELDMRLLHASAD
jgi:hypothetical protein